MKLSTVRIANLKSLADTGDIALGQINVLLGRNNHGKSAFIRGVHVLQQPGPNINASDIRLGEHQASVHFLLAGENAEDLQRYFGTQVTQSSLEFTVNLFRSENPPQYSLSISHSQPTWNPPLLSPREPNNFIYT